LPRDAVDFSKLLLQNQIYPMKVKAGQALTDRRSSIEGRVGAAIFKSILTK
jgi:hypothetical protein